MVQYGFNAQNLDDQTAINNALLMAENIKRQTYMSLAQYRINDVALRPINSAANLPRMWALTLNATILGVNKPDKTALYFIDSKKNNQLGTSYITYAVNAQQFSNMLQGGLYENPQKYMQTLKELLVNKEFYRQTKTTLTTVKVPTTDQQIHVGRLNLNKRTTTYLIAEDLQAFANYGMNDQTTTQSNLLNHLTAAIEAIKKRPIKAENKEFNLSNTITHNVQEKPKLTAKKAESLPQIKVSNELNLVDDTTTKATDKMTSTTTLQQSEALVSNNQSQAKLNTIKVTDELKNLSALPDENEHTDNDADKDQTELPSLNELMEQLEKATPNNSKNIKTKHREYVDDFAKNNLRRKQLRKQKQRQLAVQNENNTENTPVKDNGLEL